jgi:hypothetical protein
MVYAPRQISDRAVALAAVESHYNALVVEFSKVHCRSYFAIRTESVGGSRKIEIHVAAPGPANLSFMETKKLFTLINLTDQNVAEVHDAMMEAHKDWQERRAKIDGNERHIKALEMIKSDAKALMKSREGK